MRGDDSDTGSNDSPLLSAGPAPTDPTEFMLEDSASVILTHSNTGRAVGSPQSNKAAVNLPRSESSIQHGSPSSRTVQPARSQVRRQTANRPRGPFGLTSTDEDYSLYDGPVMQREPTLDKSLSLKLTTPKNKQRLSSSRDLGLSDVPCPIPLSEGSSSPSSQDRGSPSNEGKAGTSPKLSDGSSVLYLEEDDLAPISPTPTINSLNILLSRLTCDDWKLQFDALTDLRRLAKHHTPLFFQSIASTKSTKGQIPFLSQVYPPLITELVDSLRSNIAKNATLALHDLYIYLGKEMSEPLILEPALSICLRKAAASGAGAFLIAEAERCLRQICLSVTAEARLVQYLLKNLKTSRQNQKLKSTIAQCLCLIILRLNAALLQVLPAKDIDALTGSIVKLASEAAPETRRYGKLAICYLYQYLSVLDTAKLRQILTEVDVRDLVVAAKLASRTLDVDALLGVPLAAYSFYSAATSETEQTLQQQVPPARAASRPRSTPRSTTPQPQSAPRAAASQCSTFRASHGVPLLASPSPSSRSQFSWNSSTDDKSMLITPRMSTGGGTPSMQRGGTVTSLPAFSSDRRAVTPGARSKQRQLPETRNASVVPQRRNYFESQRLSSTDENRASINSDRRLGICFKVPEQAVTKEEEVYNAEVNGFGAPAGRSRLQLKPVVTSQGPPSSRRVPSFQSLVKHAETFDVMDSATTTHPFETAGTIALDTSSESHT